MRTRPGPATRPVPWMRSSRAAGALAAGDGPGDGPAVSNQRPAAGTANQSATAAKAAAAPTGRSDPAHRRRPPPAPCEQPIRLRLPTNSKTPARQSQAKAGHQCRHAKHDRIRVRPELPGPHRETRAPHGSYRSQNERDTRRVESRAFTGADTEAIREPSRRRSPHQQGQTLFRTLRSALRRRLGDLDGSLTRRLRSGRARSKPLAPGLLDAFHGRNLGRLDLVAPVLPPNEHRRPHVVFPFKAVVSPPPAQCEIPRQPWFCPDLSRNFRPQRGGAGPSRVQFRSACRLIAFRHSSV